MLHSLIVEDEPLAAEVLIDYIGQVPFLSLTAHCTDAIKAMDLLKKHRIDVLFLDLHLPGLKGFELLKTLPHRPQVIITTAYHEYALQGYEWNVVDYLVKPIEFSRFLAAVNKLSLEKKELNDAEPKGSSPDRSSLFVYADKKQVKIFHDEILFIESEKDYLKIVLKEKHIVIRQTLQEFEKLLPQKSFLRIHRSFIINIDAIKAFDAAHVEISGKSLPIGRQFKDLVIKKLKTI